MTVQGETTVEFVVMVNKEEKRQKQKIEKTFVMKCTDVLFFGRRNQFRQTENTYMQAETRNDGIRYLKCHGVDCNDSDGSDDDDDNDINNNKLIEMQRRQSVKAKLIPIITGCN